MVRQCKTAQISAAGHFGLELQSKLLKVGYTGDYIGDYFRA